MIVSDFIRLEVSNQGFDLGTDAGKQRIEWMAEAWTVAEAEFLDFPDIGVIEHLGKLIEREKNRNGFRSAVNVRVGTRFAPHFGDIRYLMELLCRWEPKTEEDSLEWYRCFEIIHPFEDGNGRVGKILYNWWLRRLDDPLMPPDLWGHGVP